MRSRIMYIESKAEGLSGPARIGRVSFNRTGRSLYYKGQSFQSLKGRGFKANYRDTETGDEYWISGPRRDGLDRLYGMSALVVEIACQRQNLSDRSIRVDRYLTLVLSGQPNLRA
jgi:hypothetical protein